MERVVWVDNLMLGPFTKFNIEVLLNSFTIITGSNNSGKSLLLKVIAGVINTKRVIYNKEIIKDDTIRYPLECLGMDDEKIKKIVKDMAKDLDITRLLDSKIKDLNDFERLKVALASLLVSGPKLLILDDPCLYLSFYEKEEFMGILEQVRSSGTTIVMSCSSLEEVAYTINSTLYVLDKGNIVSSGDSLKVLSDDSLLNKVGLELPFMVDLSVKLEYYNLAEKINMSPLGLVDSLWK